jgi:hypothetical protein
MPESVPLVIWWSVVHLNGIVVVPGFGAHAWWPLGGGKCFAGREVCEAGRVGGDRLRRVRGSISVGVTIRILASINIYTYIEQWCGVYRWRFTVAFTGGVFRRLNPEAQP